ncbi:MAG: Crp/Fnr family transcriptional regulator [Alphaproteobacteria bacterium]|nr:Crp/Fnr family transcriptional regulator [Alphaproteobacteria bacterium]
MNHTLSEIPLLTALPEAKRAELEKRCVWKSYSAHEQIIDHDSDTRDVFFVVEGLARVVIYSFTGREISFDDIGPGGFFGELAAIDNEPRSANVVALQPTLVAILPQEAFLDLIRSRSELALPLMGRLVRIIRESTMRIMDLSTLGANNRVMAEILREARPGIRDDNTARISPIPIHADMASRASTTRETVARVMSDLAKRELVRRERDALVILNVEKLEDMVEHFHSV